MEQSWKSDYFLIDQWFSTGDDYAASGTPAPLNKFLLVTSGGASVILWVEAKNTAKHPTM